MKGVRNDFTVLSQKVPPVYFDNACMTLKPRQVTDAIMQYYEEFPGCGQRSPHKFGTRVTEEVRKARKEVKDFLSAKKSEEIIFTRNTTESINLVAKSFPFSKGVTLSSNKEHNSNLLPWQVHENDLKQFDADNFSLQTFQDSWPKRTQLLAINSHSNLDGSGLPIKEMIRIAHDNGALVLLDAAQTVPHEEVNVKKLNADFLAFSGHKVFGPTGTGVLYAKEEHLERMTPFLVGGDTVFETTYDSHQWEDLPHRFEAGLQDYANILGLGAGIKYAQKLGLKNIHNHIIKLNEQLTIGLGNEKILGPTDAKLRGGITSFIPRHLDVHEVALMLDQNNIMVRSGAHCVHSWFNAHNLSGSVRTSLYAYNTEAEVDTFLEEYKKIKKLL